MTKKEMLGNLITTQKGYAFKSTDYLDKGVGIIRVSDFTDCSISKNNLVYIDPKLAENYKQYKLFTNDVIIQTVGSWPTNPLSVVGKVVKAPSSINGFLLNQNAVKIIPNETINLKYLYYLLKSKEFSSYIVSCARGAASQASITLDDIKNYEFIKPSLDVQIRIASVLSNYDDLIENNNKRIKILEEMAQKIYKEWFVDFKFPGHETTTFKDSELGKIPQDWNVKFLYEVSKLFDSKRKPLSSIQRAQMQGVYPYYGAAKILDFISDYIFDGKYILMAEDGSVITKDGYPVLQFVNTKFWANNHTHILQGVENVSTEFIYLFLQKFSIAGYITGAAQPKINQENLNRIKMIIPNKKILTMFNNIISPIFEQIFKIELKNKILNQTRDILLPRLISGEIDVENMEIA